MISLTTYERRILGRLAKAPVVVRHRHTRKGVGNVDFSELRRLCVGGIVRATVRVEPAPDGSLFGKDSVSETTIVLTDYGREWLARAKAEDDVIAF